MAKQTFTTGQVLTAAQVNSLQANDFNQTVSVKTANYILAAADKGTRIEFNTSGSVTCTVNSGLFDAGDTLVIQNRGAGTATITAGTATVNTSASLALAQYSAGTLYFVSDSAALFFGDAAGISASIVDAKGDLIVGTADNTVARLAVGTNGHTLVADSVETTGLKWVAPSGSLPAWTAYTPSSTGAITQGNGTLTARYMESNTTVIVQIKFAFGSTSSISGATFFSLPVSIKTNNFFYGNVYLYDNGAANYAGAIQAQGTTTYLYALSRPTTYVEFSSVNASVPHSWTNTDEIFVVLVYEKA